MAHCLHWASSWRRLVWQARRWLTSLDVPHAGLCFDNGLRREEWERAKCNERKELKDSHARSDVVSGHLTSLSLRSIFNRPLTLPGSPRVTPVEERKCFCLQTLLEICQEHAQVTFHPTIKYWKTTFSVFVILFTLTLKYFTHVNMTVVQ